MKRRSLLKSGLFLCNFVLAQAFPVTGAMAQSQPRQAGNETYSFANENPAFEPGSGAKITIHRNVSPYVVRGSFDVFKYLAETDGFAVDWLDTTLDSTKLAATDILVVANPYIRGGALDYRNFGTLDAPSVYSEAEIALIEGWVKEGGALLLLADHSPFAGGGIKLAEAFGFTFMTGFAIHKSSFGSDVRTNVDFRKDDKAGIQIGKLGDHPITTGGLGRSPVDHFFAFGGQAIIPPPGAADLLTLPDGFETVLTMALREEFDTAMRLDSSGFSQGAVLEHGEGKVAVFGETGAFTSQVLDGDFFFGLGAAEAGQNEEFVLSVIRWLAGYKPS